MLNTEPTPLPTATPFADPPPRNPGTRVKADPAAVAFCVELADVHAHLFHVTLTIARPAAEQLVALPVWIPGSYLVREFARSLQTLTASQSGATPPVCSQIDKCSWQVSCDPKRALEIRYLVYARDNSVRSAWLDAERGFFNGTSLFLRVEGQHHEPHTLEIARPAHTSSWSLATGLLAQKIDTQGFGLYKAANYDELVDCPVEMGAFWSGSFTACGVPHRFVVAGALPTFDGERLLADTQRICETQIRFWHGNKKPPFKNYVFMLNAVDDAYGGLEHRNSTALICKRKDLPRLGEMRVSEGYTTLRGLISHEYFHTWNVKRLRPAEFESYAYDRENYTEMLWFFEGFTSYYDDLLLRRAGLLDNAGYLKLLNKTINQVMQTPGRLVQSVAEASFDAWVKYYRQDENTPNTTVSYYTKGALVALCLDLTLRAESPSALADGSTLDAVLQTLWQQSHGGAITEADFACVLALHGQRPFTAELADWVHGTGELPLQRLLEQHGVGVVEEPGQLAHRLGLRVDEGQALVVKVVLRGGAAEAAGFAPGDEWLGIERDRASPGDPLTAGWRMRKLDDLLGYIDESGPRADAAGESKASAKRKAASSVQAPVAPVTVTALVSRDQRLLRLHLAFPPVANTWRLAVKDASLLDAWLAQAA
jgi:predicted metalloprotease with PDZ domain